MTTGEPSIIFFYLFIKLSLHRPRWIKLKRFFYFQIKEPPGMHIEWTEWFGTESAENIRYVEWRASSSGLFAGRAHFCVLWNRKRHSSELNRSRRIRRKFHESAPVSVLKTLAIVLFYCLSFILLKVLKNVWERRSARKPVRLPFIQACIIAECESMRNTNYTDIVPIVELML